MSMKKKALMGASYVLVAAMAIGGTVAYLTDTDSDTNTMTLGNVKIEQHEYERVEGNDGKYEEGTITEGEKTYDSYILQDFTQGKLLVPTTKDPSAGGDWDATTVRMSQVDSYGGMQVFEAPNAQDKFVTVENTGKTDAYIRTIVALEVGSADPSLIGISYHTTWTKNSLGVMEINGNNYAIFEFAYNGGKLSNGTWRHEKGILPAGDTSYPNLSQVYLKAVATNEDVEKLDGNGNGTFDILVLSQAIQAEGFDDAQTALDTAFGKVAEADLNEWFKDSFTVAEPESGAVRPAGYIPATEGEVIDNLIVNDKSDDATNLRALYTKNGNLTGDLTVKNSYLDGTYAMNVTADEAANAVLTVENTALKGWTSFSGFASVSFTSCIFDVNTSAETYKTIRPYDTTVFTDCDFAAGYEFLWDKLGADDTVTFVNCTIGGIAITDVTQVNGTAAVTVK